MWQLTNAVLFVIALGLHQGFSFPYDELMQEQYDDTALVESTIREARAIRPKNIHDLLGPGVKQAYIHTFGDEPGADANVQGYLKKMNDKGDDGYKHFDSFHKKDSDKYGFEVHSEFGKLDKAEVDTGSGKHAEHQESEKDGTDETKESYKVVEEPERGSSYYDSDDNTDESANFADGESETEEEEEEKSSPYTSFSDEGDGENESYEESSAYSSDDDDKESEGYSEDDDEE